MRRHHLGALLLAGAALALPAHAAAATTTGPVVTTGPAKNVTYSGATLTGTVNPNGHETDYYFQYGTTRSYGSRTQLTPAGNGSKNVAASASISGLTPNTAYHYRLVAVGASTQDGGDRTFTTPKVPLTVAINGSPNPVQFGSPFVVTGVLSGTGNGNREVVLQATPFPYTTPYRNVGNPEVTNPDGSFTFPFPGLLQSAKLRVVTVNTNPPVVSPELVEQVAVRVALHVKHSRRRGMIRLSGTVTPPEVGAQVVLQRLTRNGPVTAGHTSVVGGTTTVARFGANVRKHKHTLYRAVVTFPAGEFAPNTSSSVLVR